jgi:hypothetical protein
LDGVKDGVKGGWRKPRNENNQNIVSAKYVYNDEDGKGI